MSETREEADFWFDAWYSPSPGVDGASEGLGFECKQEAFLAAVRCLGGRNYFFPLVVPWWYILAVFVVGYFFQQIQELWEAVFGRILKLVRGRQQRRGRSFESGETNTGWNSTSDSGPAGSDPRKKRAIV